MRKLLSANLSRLFLNKTFWKTVVLTALLEGLICSPLLWRTSVPIDFRLFIFLLFIGVFVSVFCSLFFGTEYSDGTIRNKIIAGHKRSSIYLASLITGIIAVSIIYFAGILTGSLIGIITFDSIHNSIGQIAIAGAIGWLSCISYASIFNLAGMLSSSKAKTSIICVMTAFTLMIVGLVAYSLLGQEFMSATATAICTFLVEFNPFGQVMLVLSIIIDAPLKLAAYALSLSTVLTVLGLIVFSKKDLK